MGINSYFDSSFSSNCFFPLEVHYKKAKKEFIELIIKLIFFPSTFLSNSVLFFAVKVCWFV